MVITHKLGVDADLGVVFCTIEELLVSAGQAAIAWLTAGLSAVVRIPVFGAILFSDESFDVFADFCVIRAFVYFPVAHGLIVNFHIIFFSACLDGKDTV